MELTPALRRRLAPLLLVGGLVAILVPVARSLPVEVTVEVRYGAARAGLRRARLSYATGDGVERTVAFPYEPGRAPVRQRHLARLRPTDYELRIELDEGHARRVVTRHFRARSGTIVAVDVGPSQ